MRKQDMPTITECNWIIKLAEDDITRCERDPDAHHPAMRMRVELMAGIADKMRNHILSEQQRQDKISRLDRHR